MWCREEDLEIPGGVIEGPNMDLENKEFISVLTINEKERVSNFSYGLVEVKFNFSDVVKVEMPHSSHWAK